MLTGTYQSVVRMAPRWYSDRMGRGAVILPPFSYISTGSVIDQRAKALFNETEKSLAEKEYVTEKLKTKNAMLWVQKR